MLKNFKLHNNQVFEVLKNKKDKKIKYLPVYTLFLVFACHTSGQKQTEPHKIMCTCFDTRKMFEKSRIYIKNLFK